MSNENPPCPDCGGKLVNKEWIPRGKKEAGGHRLIRIIERRRCVECGRSHRLLPDDQVPYKHYSAEVIEKVVDEDYEFIEEEALEYEDYPCEATMGRWRAWAVQLVKNAEGGIRSAAHRVLDLSNEFLRSTESLLKGIKKFAKRGWLTFVIRIMIESGGAGMMPEAP